MQPSQRTPGAGGASSPPGAAPGPRSHVQPSRRCSAGAWDDRSLRGSDGPLAVVTQDPSGRGEAFLDEVAHQPLGPLLELGQHLVGAADLVPLQTVQDGDAHHGRCEGQKPRQGKALGKVLPSHLVQRPEVSPLLSPQGMGHCGDPRAR